MDGWRKEEDGAKQMTQPQPLPHTAGPFAPSSLSCSYETYTECWSNTRSPAQVGRWAGRWEGVHVPTYLPTYLPPPTWAGRAIVRMKAAAAAGDKSLVVSSYVTRNPSRVRLRGFFVIRRRRRSATRPGEGRRRRSSSSSSSSSRARGSLRTPSWTTNT